MIKEPSFLRQAAGFWFVGLLIIALFWLVGYSASFFFLVFGGVVFAVVISGLAHFLSDKTPLPYGASVAVVMLLLIGIIVGGGWLLAPTVSEQADQLAESLPASIDRLQQSLRQTSWGKRILDGIPENPGKLLSRSGSSEGVLTKVTGVFSSTLGALVNMLIVLITGVYLAANPGSYRKGFARLFNPGYRDRLLEVMDQCYDTLKNWFISRSITMTVVGVVTGVGLAIMGIPFAIVLGIIAGILNFIPNLGPYISLIPAVLVAFPEGMYQPLYVVALYMGVQSLEGYVLTPLLDKKFVSVPPALLLFAQVLLGLLVGLSGVLFASPLVAVMLVIVQELYIKDRLEKKAENKTEPTPQ